MLKNKYLFGFYLLAGAGAVAVAFGGCGQPNSATGGSLAAALNSLQGGSTTSSGSGSSSTNATTNAFQVITKADPTGSFDGAAVPLSGGVSVKASRIYDLTGSVLTSTNIPTWFRQANVFLTSTRTSPGIPGMTTSDTPCAYFHSNSSDNNSSDPSGYYTIDGYNPSVTQPDIDQCAGTAASELNQVGLYVQLDRTFMNATDKLQIIVKAKLVDTPNLAPTSSSCVVGGFFDGSACSNQYYTVTMRTAPGAAAKPFYILFPSAKALDLLSESVLLPINVNTSISTISIDRVKGGAIFYGISVIRLQ